VRQRQLLTMATQGCSSSPANSFLLSGS
jgi:hypothetical protein